MRFFNAFGKPLDEWPAPTGRKREIGGPPVEIRSEGNNQAHLFFSGIAGIDLNNTILGGQKIPFFADPESTYNEVMATVALRLPKLIIMLGGMGLSNDDLLF